jgi:SAM-dependent methyltransferase
VDDLRDHERWDVIAAFQTIEHLVDVRSALRRVREALRPHGLVFLTTPDHGSLSRRVLRGFWLSYRPEHLLYFDQRSLRRILEEERFQVDPIGADDPLVVPVPIARARRALLPSAARRTSGHTLVPVTGMAWGYASDRS